MANSPLGSPQHPKDLAYEEDVCAGNMGGRVDDQERRLGKPLSADAAGVEQP
jgi:hypothetical protein